MVKWLSNLWNKNILLIRSSSILPRLCFLSFYSSLSHTLLLHKSPCHRGTWRCRQSQIIKRMGLFFLQSAFPLQVALVTSPPCYGSFAYGIPFSEARDIQRAVVTALRHQNPHVSASLTAPDHDVNIYLGWWMRALSLCFCHRAGIRLRCSLRCRISDPYL